MDCHLTQDTPSLQMAIFLKVLGLAVKVETSCKRALRSRPFIIAHREVILDASPEAVALGITRAMGTDSVERTFPQVHIERPLFAAGLNGIRDRYEKQSSVARTFLSNYCHGLRQQYGMELDQVDWDEFFVDFSLCPPAARVEDDRDRPSSGELLCSQGDGDEGFENWCLDQAREIGRGIKAGITGVLGFGVVVGVGFERGEAQEDAWPRVSMATSGLDEDDQEKAVPADQEGPMGPTEQRGVMEAQEAAASSAVRDGQEAERADFVSMQEAEGGGNAAGTSGAGSEAMIGMGGLDEDDEMDVDVGVIDVGSEDGSSETEQGYVCDKCRGFFDTEGELELHLREAMRRDDERRRREAAAKRRMDTTHTRPRTTGGQKQSPAKARAGGHAVSVSRPGLSRVEEASRLAGRRPVTGPPIEGQGRGAGQETRGPKMTAGHRRRPRRAAESFTAVLASVHEEADVRGYLQDRGLPLLELPDWPLTPIDMTDEHGDDEGQEAEAMCVDDAGEERTRQGGAA